ncbi:hypothetical protein POV27_07535 [Aureisphaera galaxeae]|uniref:hypothetical protein n=1 Tax=Aureisphaera galaxeae TaxID=1538023 RepID=UPI00235102AC|nr:hypothetical protein [Aureisphaera galaxeae]MDC8003899.1 hypothetical protein [Aureisphaera galaxeae]
MKKGLLFLIFVCITTIGYGCDCKNGSVAQNFKAHQVVITAEVIGLSKVFYRDDVYRIQVELKVTESFKGGKSGTIKIITGNGYGDCGFHFEQGNRYLIFASLSDVYSEGAKEELTATVCSHTGLVDKKSKQIKVVRNLM